MLTEQQLKHVQETWRTGHGPYDVAYKDLVKLDITDNRLQAAFSSRSRWQVSELAPATLKAHGRLPIFDGIYGPAVRAMLETPRCNVPDIVPPDHAVMPGDFAEIVERMKRPAQATASGNWSGCHGVGQFHSAAVLD